jgi:hypothetical protein
MSLGTRYKDPQEERLFTFDWTQHLGTDTIVSSSIAVEIGLVKESEAIAVDSKKATVLVSGGTVGTSYLVTNTILTSAGEWLERSGEITVRQL